ncbi:MAG: hypothetical protein H6599_11955 [Flavobacteriales bacterium]|nr:hypothetical protein [Flavobacteriales bacterium]
MKKYTVLLLSLTFLVASCKKEKLEGDLEVLRGKYKWVGYNARNCTLCPLHYYDASNQSFSADIEFDNSGEISFYIDGQLYLKKRFKITKKNPNGLGGWEIEIRVDVPKSKLDINDNLSLSTVGDTLYLDKYPLPGYPEAGLMAGTVISGNILIRQ